jgi:hypothetical protein
MLKEEEMRLTCSFFAANTFFNPSAIVCYVYVYNDRTIRTYIYIDLNDFCLDLSRSWLF